MKNTTKGLTSLAIGVGMTAALSGCSGGTAAADSAQSAMSSVTYDCSKPNTDTKSNISLTAMPLVSNGAIYAGIDQGFFAKHGITLDISTVSSLPATISAVQGGTTDMAFAGNISLFQALDKNIDLNIVAPFAGMAPKYWDKMQAGEAGFTREITALMVAPDSQFKSPGDLNGKTVAVGDAQGQGELTLRSVIKEHGGDPSTVKYVVMSSADATNALMAGKVDAAMTTEPAMVKAEQAGYKILSWPVVETLKEGPTSSIVASADYIKKNPETVARFNCGIREANAYANDHHDVIRQRIAQEQKVDPATLAKAVVPYFYTSMDIKGLERFAGVTKSFGFIKKDIDMNALVIPQAKQG
ncbi:hypothetical protein StoSoilB3_17870 [Arthrobacter sp. StoSoilB3]|nr:hypothetical protein ANMWB30_44520 [Arthrobacter sp. MWB30]KQQ97977.1 hypothetical protein ASF74_14660 [Arthrobacter sp. Leaf145]BCW40252.1 hypothetical protein StoSoilB3_17870 [Arthrobacter sp. StoSoilB3]